MQITSWHATGRQRRGWILFIALCGLADLLVAAILPSPDDLLVAFGIGLGIVFGQVSLLAIVTALTDIRLRLRLVMAIVGLLMVGFVMGCYVARHNGPAEFTIVTALAMCVQFLWLQVPLAAMRVGGGWRIRHPSDEALAAPSLQFGIRQILAWTAAVAVLTAVGRQALLLGVSHDELGQWLNFLGPIVMFNGLIMLPLMWAMLSPTRSRYWLPVSLACVVALTAVEIYLVNSLRVVPVPQSALITCLNGFQIMLLMLALRAVKRSGFELRQAAREIGRT